MSSSHTLSRVLLVSLVALCIGSSLVDAASSGKIIASSSSWFVVGQVALTDVTLEGIDVDQPIAITVALFTADPAVLAPALASATATLQTPHSAPEIQISFTVPTGLETGEYHLQVSAAGTGIVPLLIPAVSSKVVLTHAEAVFLETDKSLYQPGQKVKIAVVALDYSMLPSSSSPFLIEILSPYGYKIMRTATFSTDVYGFATTEWVLGEEPEQGEYVIRVLLDDSFSAGAGKDPVEVARNKFKVERYVLPMFHPTITCTPDIIMPSTQSVECTVTAKFLHGTMVKGVANITVTQNNGYFSAYGGGGAIPAVEMVGNSGNAPYPGFIPNPPFSQLLTLVNGSGKFTLNLKSSETPPVSGSSTGSVTANVPWPTGYGTGDMIINITVTDSSSQHAESADLTLKQILTNVNLELVGRDGTSFKPGLDFQALLFSRTPSGSPVDGTYQLSVHSSSRSSYQNQQIAVTTTNGVGLITVHVPSGTTWLSFSSWTASYWVSASFDAAWSPSATYLTVGLQSGQSDLVPGATAKFDVSLSLNRTIMVGEIAPGQLTLHYSATNRGRVVAAGTFLAIQGPTPAIFPPVIISLYQGQFEFAVTEAMAPNMKVVVWFVATGNVKEVVADYTTIAVSSTAGLTVNTVLNQTTALPNDPIEVKIVTSSPARVLVTAVDQAVVNLGGKEGRIELAQVMQVLAKRPAWINAFLATLPEKETWMTRIVTSSDAFLAADLVLISADAFFPTAPVNPWGDGGVAVDPVMADGGLGAGPVGGAPRPELENYQPPPSAGGLPYVPARAVRRFFPESWIHALLTTQLAQSQASVTVDVRAPHSMTTWNFYTIGISPTQGIGFGSVATLQVSQPLFVDLQLPASAVRGEVVPVTATVFNNLPTEVQVSLTLYSLGTFNLTSAFGTPVSNVEEGEFISTSTHLTIAPGDSGSSMFYAQPLYIGSDAMTVAVAARTAVWSDTIERKLTIRAPGFETNYVMTKVVEVTASSPQQIITVVPELPPSGVVSDSARLQFTVTGDLLSKTIDNIDGLVRMPTGCGEQNMITFAPLIPVMKYLAATGALSAELNTKLTNYMSSGYVRELNYQHRNGSFSAFGRSDASGSMWLSAFVLKTYAQARAYIFVDPEVLTNTTAYILSNQNADGSFNNVGTVVHGSGLFGGSGNHGQLAFTAYVMIALLEVPSTPALAAKIALAQSYIETNLGDLQSNTYSIALVAYALIRADSTSPKIQTLLAHLDALSVEDADGAKHLPTADTTTPGTQELFCYACGATTYDVEATAYWLLAVTQRNDLTTGLALSKYLTKKQSNVGGYYSTQDTVMGIDALATYGVVVRSTSVSLKAEVYRASSVDASGTPTDDPLTQFELGPTNFDLLQSADLSTELINVPLKVRIVGTGTVVTQFILHYNLETDPIPSANAPFELRVAYHQTTSGNSESLVVTSCLSLSESLMGSDSSADPGMVLMTVGLFSGFQPDDSSLDALTRSYLPKVGKSGSDGVKRWEHDAVANRVVLYIDGLTRMSRSHDLPIALSTATNNHVCFQFKAFQTIAINARMPTQSSAYRYYAPQARSSVTVTYEKIAPAPAPQIQEDGFINAVVASSTPSIQLLLAVAIGTVISVASRVV